MKITFSPIRSDATLSVVRKGEVLTINGTIHDLSAATAKVPLPATAVSCDWLLSDVTRRRGELCLTLALPYDPDTAAPDVTTVTLTADGPVTLPPHQPRA